MILRVLGGLALILLILVGYAIYPYIYLNLFKSHLQTLQIKHPRMKFMLFTDMAGGGDTAWYVYRFTENESFTWTMKQAQNQEGVLFWNYSEAGNHLDNAKIEIKNEKYLVFSRGGRYFSLYDIETEKVLINDECPWCSFQETEEFKEYSQKEPKWEQLGYGMDRWVQNHLHSKIEAYLNNS